MSKLKTSKGVRKRMRLTRTGKIKRFKANRGHLMASKNAKRRRRLRRSGLVRGEKVKNLRRMLGAPN